MQLKLKNIDIPHVISLFYDLKLKAKQSRHRTKFIKSLSEQWQEVSTDEEEIAKQYCHLDDEGTPKKIEENGRQMWDMKDGESLNFAKDRNDLYRETYIIDGANNQETLKIIAKILVNLDAELSGQQADIYDDLCEQLIENEN